MKKDSPAISVVIPFLEGPRGIRTIQLVIESCNKQTISPEIIVASNFPHPELEQYCQERGVKFFQTNARGVNVARNMGAEMAGGEFLYFLDDDCVLLDPRHLELATQILQSNPGLWALGGPYGSQSKSNWRAHGYNAMASAWSELGAKPWRANIFKVKNLLGGNFCLAKASFGTGFNEDIISGGDEAEFFQRTENLRRVIGYTKQLEVIHLADESWAGLFRRAQNQGRALAKHKISQANLWTKLNSLCQIAIRDVNAIPFLMCHFSILTFQKWIAPHISPKA